MNCPDCGSDKFIEIDHIEEPGRSFIKLKCPDCGGKGAVAV